MYMAKKHAMITVDEDLHKKAREMGLNISAISEQAISRKMVVQEVEIEGDKDCDFCGKVEPQATANSPIGMTWLWPDERWICDSCLKRKSARAQVGFN